MVVMYTLCREGKYSEVKRTKIITEESTVPDRSNLTGNTFLERKGLQSGMLMERKRNAKWNVKERKMER